MTHTSSVNYLNILFMISATILAVNLPFETFLFSYAVLGPLHYLTEINWLQKRAFYVPPLKPFFYYLMIIAALIAVSFSTFLVIFLYTPFLKFLGAYDFLKLVLQFCGESNNFYLYILLGLASVLVLAQKGLARIILTAFLIVFGTLLYKYFSQPFIILFSLFLPTIIHVWLFTGLFVVAGAIKSKSSSAWLSIIVYILCSVYFFIMDFDTYAYKPSGYVKDTFIQSNFNQLNIWLNHYLFGGDISKPMLLNSKMGLKIQAFIAFAYTYHYLNWFSKTTIIKWHDTKVTNWVIIAIIWVGSVALYYYNYKIGLASLFFLSILHVIAEFPLNWVVTKEIFQSMIAKFHK
ncbi:MAG: hypothetical protein SFY32_04535 [Bacteroidota bacterium]|nr:hypothetical protein [Bacteroidota bacterium]